MSLGEILLKAHQEGWSTGHFNASELDHMRAIIEACKESATPAMVGTSEGERKHFGAMESVALRDVFRKEYGIPIFLNADHTKSVEAAKAAIDAGYDSIHIDLSAKPFNENVAGTREIVDYITTTHKLQPTNFSVEGELGYLRGDSKIQHEKIEIKPEDYTNPEEAKRFVELTGVNRLAIAVGNIHGISLDEPTIDVERIHEIRKLIPKEVALVLHAGSGIPDDKIKAAIEAGIANIHINTDIRVAYKEGFKKGLEEHPDEAAIYKIDQEAINAMKNVIKEKLTLFGAVNRI